MPAGCGQALRIPARWRPATQSEPRLVISGGHALFLFAEEIAGSYALRISGKLTPLVRIGRLVSQFRISA